MNKSFTIPSPGNRITNIDIKYKRLRITVRFKEFFPAESTNISLIFNNKGYSNKFTYRPKRSHIIHLHQELAKELNLVEGAKIKFTTESKDRYRIER